MIFAPVSHKISELLVKNYLQIKRDLPWRHTKDPYLLWLSEVILQQTRVAQGLPYFLRFAERFPDVGALAGAQEDEVLRLWQGLGYYSRARNMHATAKEVMTRFEGVFPSSYHDLVSLRGIGDYTASAVASFATGEAAAVVDGNVIRVLSRLFGIQEPADTPKGKRIFKEIATEILNKSDAGLHNQAIMEFGALVCTPKKPDCLNCELAYLCEAQKIGGVNHFPVKREKKKQRDRFFTYLHFSKDGFSWVEKRDNAEIWKGLYQFPLIETDFLPSESELPELVLRKIGFEVEGKWVVGPKVTHILSHQKLHIRFVRIIAFPPESSFTARKWKDEELDELAFPAVIVRYIRDFLKNH